VSTDEIGGGNERVRATLVLQEPLESARRGPLEVAASEVGLLLELRESTQTRSFEAVAWTYLLTLPLQEFLKGLMNEEGKAASLKLRDLFSQLVQRTKSSGSTDDNQVTLLVRDTASHRSWIISDISQLDPEAWYALVNQALATSDADDAQIEMYVWDSESKRWSALD
jgi:hypothetical protein